MTKKPRVGPGRYRRRSQFSRTNCGEQHLEDGRSLEQWLQNAIFRARPFGLPDWRAEPRLWAHWAERWSAERLRGALAATLAADQSLKSTTLRDEASTMLDLVLELAASAGRRAA